MSKDEIFNKLCAVFFMEESRLEIEVERLYIRLKLNKFDSLTMIEYIQAVARQEYFRKYMLDVLDYLRHFDR